MPTPMMPKPRVVETGTADAMNAKVGSEPPREGHPKMVPRNQANSEARPHDRESMVGSCERQQVDWTSENVVASLATTNCRTDECRPLAGARSYYSRRIRSRL